MTKNFSTGIQNLGTACEVIIDNCLDGVSQTCTPGAPTEEICDGIDNNCNGEIDEGGVCETVAPPAEDVCDAAHLNLCLTETDCTNAEGFWYNEACNTETEEPEEPVCEPTEEICDGIDNNCDGQIDEGDVCETPEPSEEEPPTEESEE